MKRSILEIYALLVCLISILVAMVSIHALIFNTVKYVNPMLSIGEWEIGRLTNDHLYKISYLKRECKKENISDEELKELRISEYETKILINKTIAKKEMVESFIYVILSIALFISHWIIAKKQRSNLDHT